MRTRPLFLTLRHLSRLCVLLLAFAIVLATVFTPACGVGQPTVTPVQGFTSVTVLLSGTLNDQLSKVIVALGSISLTSQSGKTVNLYTPSQSNGATPGYEFVHLNGIAEPLTTVVIAQGVYNSATVTITSGSYMSCVLANPPGNPDSLEVFVNTPFTLVAGPTTPVTVNMPTPVTINGYAMGITLNMLLPQSAFSACTNYGSVSVLPTFNLIPVTFSAQPTNAENGKETNLEGQISFVNSANNSFTMVLSDGQTLSVKSNGSTVYQGVKGFSALTAGTFVDMDAAIQSDGSQLATRIAVENNNITDLTVATGPVFEATPSAQIVSVLVRQEQGYLGPASPPPNLNGPEVPYDSTNTVYQISEQFTNLQDLPFPATFNAANIFGGQNVYVTTNAATINNGYPMAPATTVTLMPQTLNGTVVGVSSSGDFQIYSVSLASYDLPPVLNSEPGQYSALNNPGTVEVYVDSNTQLLNKLPLALGAVFRFNGLLFNDDGTMRMDCGEVNDGVAE